MINRCLWLLLTSVLVRVSIQQCTMERFERKIALDLVQVYEESEVFYNYTITEIIYNCLATSDIIGMYTSMSVSILYTRSDAPDEIRDVRFDMKCMSDAWRRYVQGGTAYTSNTTRTNCSNCYDTSNDDHCRPCDNACTGLNLCNGSSMASECCNFNDNGHCTEECGTNKVANSTFHCVCSNFWTGDSCENCSLVCMNGGTQLSDCSACQCTPGYEGTVCDVNIDECDPDPCQNGGNCTDLINDYSCTGCAAGYTGKNCSYNIDECLTKPCLNGGGCIDEINSYTCNCLTGFNGTNCQINIDDCFSNPCQNGGTCIDGINGYSCSCKPLHTGPNCSDCVILDCEECVESKDNAVGECTKCTGIFVLDQGTCNDNCGISNCIVCNKDENKCTRCKEGYHLSSKNDCEGNTPHEEGQLIIIIAMSAVVLLIIIAIIITTGILYYECKKPKRKKPNNSASSYNHL